MVSTLRRQVNDEPVSLSYNFPKTSAAEKTNRVARVSLVTESRQEAFGNRTSSTVISDSARPVTTTPDARPYLVPLEGKPKTRKTPLLVKVNRALQATLIALCGLAIASYALNVHQAHDVAGLQDQVRRLNEQNSELGNRMLKFFSYQGITDSVAQHKGLRVPTTVIPVREVKAPKMNAFKAAKHHLPLLSSY